MWELKKEFKFEASHQLPLHDGKCRRLHGHSWKGRVICAGDELYVAGPKAGMLIDYSDIKTAVEPIVNDFLDHHHLNETTKLINPTSEELARWIFHKLSIHPAVAGYLVAVEIDETCTSSCRYTG